MNIKCNKVASPTCYSLIFDFHAVITFGNFNCDDRMIIFSFREDTKGGFVRKSVVNFLKMFDR